MEAGNVKGGRVGLPDSKDAGAKPNAGEKEPLREQIDRLTGPIWNEILGAPAPKVKASAKGSVFRLMLEKDRLSFEAGQAPEELTAFRKRIFLEHVARVLRETPYGASVGEIRSALLHDPYVGAMKPNLTLDEIDHLALEELYERKRYFETRWGSEEEAFAKANGRIQGSLEQHLALLKDVLAAPPQLLPARTINPTNQWGHVSVDAIIDVEVSDATKGDPTKAPEHHATRYAHMDRAKVLSERFMKPDVAPEILCLRRTVQGVPAHATFDDIAAAHDRFADYYAPYTGGPKRFTGGEVEALFHRYPDVLGAEAFYERRLRFQTAVEDALVAAAPGANLYEVLDRACRDLEATGGSGLLAEDLFAYIVGSAELCATLDAHFDHRKSEIKQALYPELAKRVLDVFGDRLGRYSVSEIAMRMRVDDPRFSEGLLMDLIAERPELGGAERFAKAQRNFVIAAHVATMMHRAWPGATYDQVARFLVSLGPRGQVPPDFTAKDIELLQGYDFVPKWPGGKKPDAQLEQSRLAQSALMRELEFPLSLLRPEDSRSLRVAILAALVEDPARTSLPEALVARIDRAFSRALRHALVDAFDARRGGGYGGEDAYARFERFLDAEPGSEMTEAELRELLCNSYDMKKVLWCGSALAHVLAKVQAGTYEEAIVDRSWTVKNDLGVGRKVEQADRAVSTLFAFRSAHKELLNSLELHGFRTKRSRESLERLGLIPMVLEATQKVVDATIRECRDAGRPLPFAKSRVVMVQHELGDAYAQVRAYTQLGMDPAKCSFVGIPYHPNPEVEETLIRSTGVDGRFSPQGDIDAFHRAIESAVDDAVAKRAPGEKILIVCDGPYARDYFDRAHLAKDPKLAKVVVFTEQTSRGDRPRHRADKTKRVVSYARHPQKKREAEYVGRIGVRAIEDVLFQLKDTFEKKPVLINALGPIGRSTAIAFAARGARVYAYDANPTDEMRAWAKEHGVELVTDAAEAAKGKFMIVGCAGDNSVIPAQIDNAENGTYLVSLSSELLEINLQHIAERATNEQGQLQRVLAARVNQQPTYYYWLDDGTVRVVIAGGLPANFNDVNAMPPEVSDYVIAMSVAAGVEAMESGELGYFTLTKFSDFIYEAFDAYLERWEKHGRPS